MASDFNFPYHSICTLLKINRFCAKFGHFRAILHIAEDFSQPFACFDRLPKQWSFFTPGGIDRWRLN
jgi:hypothetical protein